MADVKNGVFGTIGGVELVDFEDASGSINGPFKPTPYLAVYSLNLNAAKAQINKLAVIGGLTQFRLRFKLDDNNDAAADLLDLFSGDTTNSADGPKLVITYRMP